VSCRCGYQFCWFCGGKYTSNHFSPYNPLGCPGLQHQLHGNKPFNLAQRLGLRALIGTGIIIVAPVALGVAITVGVPALVIGGPVYGTIKGVKRSVRGVRHAKEKRARRHLVIHSFKPHYHNQYYRAAIFGFPQVGISTFLFKAFHHRIPSDDELAQYRSVSGQYIPVNVIPPVEIHFSHYAGLPNPDILDRNVAYLFAFSVADSESFNYLKELYECIIQISPYIPLAVVALKCDLPSVVTNKEIEQLSRDFKCPVFRNEDNDSLYPFVEFANMVRDWIPENRLEQAQRATGIRNSKRRD